MVACPDRMKTLMFSSSINHIYIPLKELNNLKMLFSQHLNVNALLVISIWFGCFGFGFYSSKFFGTIYVITKLGWFQFLVW